MAKYAIKTGESKTKVWHGGFASYYLWWKNKTPRETVSRSFRRVYGSRSEAKKDLRRLLVLGFRWQGAEIVEVDQ